MLNGYCTVAYADSVNVTTEWVASTTEEKEFAITISARFIDSTYTCLESADWIDDLTTPEEVQWANAYLAEQYILGSLTTSEPIPNGNITQKMVKAGSVETMTTYQGLYGASSGKFKDQYKEATLMLTEYCTLGNSSKTLTRV